MLKKPWLASAQPPVASSLRKKLEWFFLKIGQYEGLEATHPLLDMWMQIPKLYRKLKLEFNQGCHWGCVYI